MRTNSFVKNRKAITALFLCTGFISTQPIIASNFDEVIIVQSVNQQKITVNGIVKDALGDPVIGASILEVGTNNGTITDLNGSFKLETTTGATLIISYIGYKSQEIKAMHATTFNITLQEDSETLDEVVVVGYGTQNNSDIPGSVTSVN